MKTKRLTRTTGTANWSQLIAALDEMGIELLDDFVVCRPEALEGPKARSGDPDTSKLAALRNEPRRGTQRATILGWLRVYAGHGDGRTADEIAIVAGLPLNTVSTRMSELERGGHVEKTGERRKTRAGGEANVYRAVTKAPEGKGTE